MIFVTTPVSWRSKLRIAHVVLRRVICINSNPPVYSLGFTGDDEGYLSDGKLHMAEADNEPVCGMASFILSQIILDPNNLGVDRCEVEIPGIMVFSTTGSVHEFKPDLDLVSPMGRALVCYQVLGS